MTTPQRYLATAGTLSATLAALHLAIIFVGPDGYAYFGAPELGTLERQGSVVPDLVTAPSFLSSVPSPTTLSPELA